MLKIITILFVFTVVTYGLMCYLLYKNQEKMVFFPEVLPDDFEFDYNAEEVFFQPQSEVRLHALHFKPDDKPKGLVMYFHGNAGSLKDWGEVAGQFMALGYEVLMPDYRGYGKSKGALSEQALFDDALWIYESMKKELPESDIILYGRSLGTGVVSDLATKTHPRLVILESPLYSAVTLAKERMPFLPIHQLMKYRFDNYLKIKRFNSPFHVFHGTKDAVIPYKHCLKLLQDFQPTADYLTTIEGGTHNDLADFKEYYDKLKELL